MITLVVGGDLARKRDRSVAVVINVRQGGVLEIVEMVELKHGEQLLELAKKRDGTWGVP